MTGKGTSTDQESTSLEQRIVDNEMPTHDHSENASPSLLRARTYFDAVEPYEEWFHSNHKLIRSLMDSPTHAYPMAKYWAITSTINLSPAHSSGDNPQGVPLAAIDPYLQQSVQRHVDNLEGAISELPPFSIDVQTVCTYGLFLKNVYDTHRGIAQIIAKKRERIEFDARLLNTRIDTCNSQSIQDNRHWAAVFIRDLDARLCQKATRGARISSIIKTVEEFNLSHAEDVAITLMKTLYDDTANWKVTPSSLGEFLSIEVILPWSTAFASIEFQGRVRQVIDQDTNLDNIRAYMKLAIDRFVMCMFDLPEYLASVSTRDGLVQRYQALRNSRSVPVSASTTPKSVSLTRGAEESLSRGEHKKQKKNQGGKQPNKETHNRHKFHRRHGRKDKAKRVEGKSPQASTAATPSPSLVKTVTNAPVSVVSAPSAVSASSSNIGGPESLFEYESIAENDSSCLFLERFTSIPVLLQTSSITILRKR